MVVLAWNEMRAHLVQSSHSFKLPRACRCTVLVCWLAFAGVPAACSNDNHATPANAPESAAASGTRNDVLPAAPRVRFVKLEALSEKTGKTWTSVAEFNLIDSTGATIDRKNWKLRTDSSDANDVATNAIDGNPKSLWHSRWQGEDRPPPLPHELTVDLGAPMKISGFRYLPRQDAITNGIIANYSFYVSSDGVNWGTPVSTGDFSSSGLTHQEKTVIFASQTENHAPVITAPAPQTTVQGREVSMQVLADDADADALSYESARLPTGLRMSSATGLITGTPIVPGVYAVNIRVSDNKGSAVSTSFQWSVNPAAGLASKPARGEVRFVKLEELSEINGNPWASVAEFNLIDADGVNLPRTGWTASADSADTSDKAGNAIDGNPASLWHSQWEGASPPPPHSLIVDLGKPATVRGFRYLPRQDRLTNGMLGKFRFYMSADGVNWGKPVSEGDFSTLGPPKAEKTVLLK